MITSRLRQALEERCTSIEADEERHAISRMLVNLGVRKSSPLFEIYTAYNASTIFFCEQIDIEDREPRADLLEVLNVRADGSVILDEDPTCTPIGSTTAYLRDVWKVPPGYVCLTTIDAGAFLLDLSSDAIYDIADDQGPMLASGSIAPRFASSISFFEWQLGVA